MSKIKQLVDEENLVLDRYLTALEDSQRVYASFFKEFRKFPDVELHNKYIERLEESGKELKEALSEVNRIKIEIQKGLRK